METGPVYYYTLLFYLRISSVCLIAFFFDIYKRGDVQNPSKRTDYFKRVYMLVFTSF